MSKFSKPIQVFDLFAGSGYDKNGIAGSPIRIIETVNKHFKIPSREGNERGVLNAISSNKPMKRRIIPYDPALKELARKLRKNSTFTEILVWNYLKGRQMRGYDFHRQKPI